MDKSLLAQLRDINGLDAISWWPPAPGWGLLLAAALILAGVALIFLRRDRKPRVQKAGRAEIIATLRSETDVKKKAAAISVTLRQAAIARHGRAACAGLEGQAWLDWLAQNDPAKFDWATQGKPLLDVPYAPPGAIAAADMDALAEAAAKWV